MRLFNSLTRKKEVFAPLKPPDVGFYACGPTVYGYIHIGNLRTFIFEDLLRRYLKYKGFKVTQVMNITDIDDKTIRRSNEEGIPLSEFTARYEKAFFEDIKAMNIEPAEHYPRATEHIDEMVSLVKQLIDGGYAYEQDGSFYFDVAKFKPYGALSGIEPGSTKTRSRIDQDEYEKQDVRDFALWKAKRENEPFWETEIGPGRPGWHIECSAMSMSYLGETFDLHTGGVDNMFPHHENELAQSQAATGKPLARFWLHSEYLLLDKSKMAKSMGNIYTLRDILALGYKARQLRYLLLSSHYRKQLSFSLDLLEQAGASLCRIDDFVRNLRSAGTFDADSPELAEATEKCRSRFEEAMDDDLNISKALGVLFTFIRTVNERLQESGISGGDRANIEALLTKLDGIIGVLELGQEDEMPAEVRELIDKRQEARESKNWKLADEIRDQLKEHGIVVEDTKDGVRIKRL